MLGPYTVLRGKRNLQLLFGGQVVSSFGDWLYVLALAVLVYDLTGSATVVAALTFVRTSRRTPASRDPARIRSTRVTEGVRLLGAIS